MSNETIEWCIVPFDPNSKFTTILPNMFNTHNNNNLLVNMYKILIYESVN